MNREVNTHICHSNCVLVCVLAEEEAGYQGRQKGKVTLGEGWLKVYKMAYKRTMGTTLGNMPVSW